MSRALTALCAVLLIGVGVGVEFGWPLGLIAAGVLVWLGELAYAVIDQRSGLQ